MSAPPLPPLPPKPQTSTDGIRYPGPPPPLPPLPLDLRLETERYNTPSVYELESPPHFENPLIAPRPHRLDRSIPTNMAQTLDDQIYGSAAIQQQQQQQPWSPWAQPPPNTAQPQRYYPPPPPSEQDFTQSLANLSMAPNPYPPPQFQSPPPPQHQQSLPPQPRQQTLQNAPAPSSATTAMPALTAPLPVLAQLIEAAQHIQKSTHDAALKIAWCRDVLFLVERASGALPSTDPPVGPVALTNIELDRLAHIAVPIVLQLASSHDPSRGKMPPHVAEAIFMRANLEATGAFPDLVRHNPRTAFRDFEAAARGGYAAAWFRLGRDYENFNDHVHAKECFERGVKANVESCLYRMGMAHLLGQLSLPQNPAVALPLLQRAALLASLTTPQPAYVYALLLLSEFTQITVPPSLLAPLIPTGSSPTLEARKHLERAAYLHFGAAQYKLGHAYEFAEPPFPFDPLLSVQYYSLASQQGEVEADMALSKWFLCGSGGAAAAAGRTAEGGGFEKDEGLALTFAEKAARKGLPSAEFAMGYYAEVGVGQPRNVAKAMEWYQLAQSHGNADATARLQALSQPAPQQLSRQEHDAITETKLVRRRTQAALRSETQPLSPPWEGTTFPTIKEAEESSSSSGGGGSAYPHYPGTTTTSNAAGRRRPDGRMVVDVIRKNSLANASLPIGSGPPPPPSMQGPGRGRLPGLREQSPQRNGGTAPPRQGSPQRIGSPGGRRAESPGRVVGGRAPSPGGRRAHNANASVGGRGDAPAMTRLERMRLNLDDSAAASTASLGQQGQGSARPHGNGYALSDSGPAPSASLPSAVGPMATPRPLHTAPSSSSVATASTTTSGGKKPQTFAEMGIHGAKAEDKDCVVM